MPRKKVEKPVEEVTSGVDTKKIMKDLEKQLNEKKEEIIKDMTSTINNQIEVSVSKRMKEEEKRIVRGKNMKILRRDLIIILLTLLVAYFGYCLYDVDYFNIRTKIIEVPTNKETNNNENNPIKEELDSKYYIDKYHYLVDNMQIEDEDIYSLYSDNTSDSISNTLKLKIAYKNLTKKEISKETITFKASDLLEAAYKIFGKDVTLENEIFSYNNTKFMFFNDTYMGFITEESKTSLVYEVYSAREKDNKIDLDVVIGRVDNNKLLNDSDEVLNENYDQVKLSDYKDKLSKYEYSFEKIKDDYVFSSIKNI